MIQNNTGGDGLAGEGDEREEVVCAKKPSNELY